jgi:hypothetical protein
LFTGREEDLVTQFQKMTVELDSLTGETVAFAVFVKRFSMTVADVQARGRRLSRTTRKRVEFDTKDLEWSISGLVKKGKLGWVAKGDELVALTYATDEVATELGVLSSLPCVVAFDGIPSGQFEVVQLTKDLIISLTGVLRASIDRMRKLPGFEDCTSALKKINEIEASSLRIQQVMEYLREESWKNEMIRSLKATSRLSHLRKILISYLSEQDIVDLLPYHTSQRTEFVDELLSPFTNRLRELRGMYASISNFITFEEFAWPLSTENFEKIQYVYARCSHLHRDRQALASITSNELTADKSILIELALNLEKRVLRDLEQALMNKIAELPQLQFDGKYSPDTSMEVRLAQSEIESTDIVPNLVSSALALGVSFSRIFCEELNRARRGIIFRHSQSDLKRIIRPWLRPQTLLSIAKWTGHMLGA